MTQRNHFIQVSQLSPGATRRLRGGKGGSGMRTLCSRSQRWTQTQGVRLWPLCCLGRKCTIHWRGRRSLHSTPKMTSDILAGVTVLIRILQGTKRVRHSRQRDQSTNKWPGELGPACHGLASKAPPAPRRSSLSLSPVPIPKMRG